MNVLRTLPRATGYAEYWRNPLKAEVSTYAFQTNEDHRLRMCEKRVPRRAFGPESENLPGAS
jgi:hypothetical protein